MYVAVKGGERAIENAHRLLAHERRGDRDVPELSLAQISEQLSLGVDRVMTEGSLYDRELAVGGVSCKAAVPDIRSLAKVSDNCQLPSERVLTQTPAPGTPISVGTYEITLTARDAADNGASCTVTMTVVDPAPVVITCPQDLTVRCTKGTGANVAFQVLAQTACGSAAPVECSPASGAFFPLGTTPVKCNVTGAPNQACSFKVIVQCPIVGTGVIAAPHPLSFSWTGNAVLETSVSVGGPWTPVPEALSPFSPAQSETQQFFRLRQPPNTAGLKASLVSPVLSLE